MLLFEDLSRNSLFRRGQVFQSNSSDLWKVQRTAKDSLNDLAQGQRDVRELQRLVSVTVTMLLKGYLSVQDV